MKRKAAVESGGSRKRVAPAAKSSGTASATTAAKDAAAASEEDYIASSGTDSDDLDLTRHDSGGSDDDGSSSDGDDDSDDSNIVNVDFLFVDPSEIDFKSVRRLLERYLPGQEKTFDASTMADAVVAQRAVGTMVKVNDDADVYGFATVLNASTHQQSPWMQAIKSYLIGKAPTAAIKKRLEAELSGSGLGILLNERIVNMPPELAPSIHDSLSKDIAWAQKNALPAVLRPSFAFTSFLLMAPCFSERLSAADTAPVQRGRKAQQQSASSSSSSSLAAAAAAGPAPVPGNTLGPDWATHFLRYEEEIFAEEATLSFSFPVDASASSSGSVPGAIGAAAASSTSSSSEPRVGTKKVTAAVAAEATAVTSSLSGGKLGKRAPAKKSSGSSAAAAAAARRDDDDSDEEDDDEANVRALHLPQSRRVVVFPASAFDRCVQAMQELLLRASEST